jgi:hypothetical protein
VAHHIAHRVAQFPLKFTLVGRLLRLAGLVAAINSSERGRLPHGSSGFGRNLFASSAPFRHGAADCQGGDFAILASRYRHALCARLAKCGR